MHYQGKAEKETLCWKPDRKQMPATESIRMGEQDNREHSGADWLNFSRLVRGTRYVREWCRANAQGGWYRGYMSVPKYHRNMIFQGLFFSL